MIVLTYPKCSTCQRAQKWLTTAGQRFTVRHIVEDPLRVEEVRMLHQRAQVPIKKFFNTSGMKYRELGLKDKLPTLSDEECYELLASDGMLVKRPLVFTDELVTFGFKEGEYENLWKK